MGSIESFALAVLIRCCFLPSIRLMSPCLSFKQRHYWSITSCAATLAPLLPAGTARPWPVLSLCSPSLPFTDFDKPVEVVFLFMPADKYILKQFHGFLFCHSARWVLWGEAEFTRGEVGLEETQQPFRLSTVPFNFNLIILIS